MLVPLATVGGARPPPVASQPDAGEGMASGRWTQFTNASWTGCGLLALAPTGDALVAADASGVDRVLAGQSDTGGRSSTLDLTHEAAADCGEGRIPAG